MAMLNNQRVRSPAVRYIQHCSDFVWSPNSQSPASSRGAILAKLADHLVRPKLLMVHIAWCPVGSLTCST